MIQRQKFRTVKSTRNDPKTVYICSLCTVYLTDRNKKIAATYENMWPGFIWNLYIDKKTQYQHRADIRRFMPLPWRHWWIDEVINNVPTLQNVRLDYQPLYFNDITNKIFS